MLPAHRPILHQFQLHLALMRPPCHALHQLLQARLNRTNNTSSQLQQNSRNSSSSYNTLRKANPFATSARLQALAHPEARSKTRPPYPMQGDWSGLDQSFKGFCPSTMTGRTCLPKAACPMDAICTTEAAHGAAAIRHHIKQGVSISDIFCVLNDC